jgi:hypothetical protein
MALTLIKEDGSGRADSNSYADSTDGDAFHEGHLYAAAWTGASADAKDKALVMATRLIDSEFQFNGWKLSDAQALQWPRARCPDPDGGFAIIPLRLLPRTTGYVDFNTVPKRVIDATCETARELLIADRTLPPDGEGKHSHLITITNHAADGSGSSQTQSDVYDKTDARRVLSKLATALLCKYGGLINDGSGPVRLTRA